MNLSTWHNLPEAAKETALEWHVRLTSGEVGDDDYEAFAEWIAADADNAAAMAWVEATDDHLARLRCAAAPTAPDRASVRPRAPLTGWRSAVGRRRAAAAIAASLVAVISGGIWLSSSPFGESSHEMIASASQLKTVTLADGTVVALAPGASLETAFDRHTRRITKFEGVGYFHVTHDKSRPFKIAFGGDVITVVGTQFEVKNRKDERSVAVSKGSVAVSAANAADDAAADRLVAGKRLSIEKADGARVIEDIDAAAVGAWRNGVFEFSEEPIDGVIKKLNGLYGAGTFSAADMETGQVRFSGVLQVSDASAVARRIGEIMPVTVDTQAGRYILSHSGEGNE